MTKAELIQKLSESTSQTKADAERGLDAVLDVMAAALEHGERLDLRGFGTFRIRETKSRQGRNPRTGDVITIAAKKVAVFKPSKELSERLNGAPPEPLADTAKTD